MIIEKHANSYEFLTLIITLYKLSERVRENILYWIPSFEIVRRNVFFNIVPQIMANFLFFIFSRKSINCREDRYINETCRVNTLFREHGYFVTTYIQTSIIGHALRYHTVSPYVNCIIIVLYDERTR